MPTVTAQLIAARIWGDYRFKHVTMNTLACKEIAAILDDVAHQQGKELSETPMNSTHEIPKKSLSFATLREANIERCESSFHPLETWSESEWGNAVAGKVGEACNLLKKRLQFHKQDHPHAYVKERMPTVEDVAFELADAITYIDLLAARMGIDLGEAIRLKFNIVSERVNSRVSI